MNPRWWSGVLVLIVGAIVLIRGTPDRDHSSETIIKGSSDSPKSRIRESELDPRHFEDLPNQLIPVAQELEQAAELFHLRRPRYEGWRDRDWAWFDFAGKQLAGLSDDTIANLAMDYLEGGSKWSMSTYYGQPLFMEWGRRDALAAEADLIRQARASGQLGNPPGLEGSNVRLEELSDLLHFVLKGLAEVDPSTAWDRYQALTRDPELKRMACPTVTPTAIAHGWAKHDPEEALELVFDTKDERPFLSLLEGFAFGAPDGQDWLALVESLESHADHHDFEVSQLVSKNVMIRWLTEDPDSALKSYERLARENAVIPDWQDYSRSPPPSPEMIRKQVRPLDYQFGLLESLGRTDDPIAQRLPRTLKTLQEGGHSDLAFTATKRFLSDRIGEHHQPFIDLIPQWQNPAEAQQLLLLAARNTAPRFLVFELYDPSLPNPGVDMLRRAALSMSLDSETRASLEAELHRVEKAEKENLADQEPESAPLR